MGLDIGGGTKSSPQHGGLKRIDTAGPPWMSPSSLTADGEGGLLLPHKTTWATWETTSSTGECGASPIMQPAWKQLEERWKRQRPPRRDLPGGRTARKSRPGTHLIHYFN